ncbi:carnitine O-palmitoyltransferase 1, liver isoform-like [Centruroides sculpturatus]|uniref:carnitine O-palmitoyltransferase 1, liver isoform-like n=1 Tax=Centruroides sculpturatus TaxID=218467 RepID=UPI000C6CE094|nr:carnitine O-palmitoyltransferase 1, liver isoform-like [Centruroides sculpturatus]
MISNYFKKPKQIYLGIPTFVKLLDLRSTSLCFFINRNEKNSIRNGMWPTSLSNLTIACTVLLFLMLTEPGFTYSINSWLWKLSYILHIPQKFPRTLRAAVTSGIVGFIFFIVLMNIRQYLLRILLSYRGWMYEPLHASSKLTLLWCAVVRLISGYQPSLYSCQRSLPRMPVPAINDTIQRLLESLKAVCTEEEFQEIEKQAKVIINMIEILQKSIFVKSELSSQSYVKILWEKYAYLKSRSPLPNNSNYYVCDQSYWTPATTQISSMDY